MVLIEARRGDGTLGGGRNHGVGAREALNNNTLYWKEYREKNRDHLLGSPDKQIEMFEQKEGV